MKTIRPTYHTPHVLFPVISLFFERLGYYGFRSMIMLFAVNFLGYQPRQTIHFYEIWLWCMAFSPLLGAIPGVFMDKRIPAIIGTVVQILGLLLLIFKSEISLYVGLALFTIGSGMYRPNLYAYTGELYRNNRNMLDSVMAILYVAANWAAALGSYFIARFALNQHWASAFAICAFFALLSGGTLTFSFLIKSPTVEKQTPAETENQFIITWPLLFVFLLMGLGYWFTLNLQDRIFADTNLSVSADATTWYLRITLFLGILVALLWSFWKFPSAYKLILGFLLFGLGNLSLVLLVGSGDTAILTVYAGIGSVVDVLLTPVLWSLIAQKGSGRFTGLLFAAYFFGAHVVAGAGYLILFWALQMGAPTIFSAFFGISVFMALLVAVFWYFLKPKSQ